MRSSVAVLALSLLLSAPAAAAVAQDTIPAATTEPWTAEELENLLAPIALYPDAILAQVLIAATFPEQIALAAAYVRTNGTRGIDDQPWEISVKAVAYYAPVLNLMAEGEDWTIALGQAYASQSTDVMEAVQSLRRMANAQGNLESGPEQLVTVDREMIKIDPAQPKVIYVPTYDPAVVYFRPIYVAQAHPAYWSWGYGYPIGVWLTYDFDWYSHRVYYHGWQGPHWVVVSRPWIVVNPIYISRRHTVIVVNRRIGDRRVDYRRLNRYSWVHRGTSFDRRADRDRGREIDRGGRRDDRGYAPRDDRGTTNERTDRRDRTDRALPGRRVTPVPTRGTVTRRELVKQPAWSSATRGGAFPSRATPSRATPSRATPSRTAPTRTAPTRSQPQRGETPRTDRKDATPRGSTPRATPSQTPRGSTTPKAVPTRQRIVSRPAWSTGRTLGPSSASRTRPSTSSRPTTTAPRASSGTRGATAAPKGSSGTRQRLVAPRSTRSTAAPRASSGSRGSTTTPRASSSGSRGTSAPRASSSGSRRSGSSTSTRSSSTRSSGSRRGN